jgi:hypothetical protein
VRKPALTSSVTSIVHHFLKADYAYKLQPGGPGYETVFGTTSALPYLLSLTPARTLDATFAAIAAHETKLVSTLLGWLTAPEQQARGVRVVGVEEASVDRLPTVSFVVVGERPVGSRAIVRVFDERGGVRAFPFRACFSFTYVARSASAMGTFTRTRSGSSYRRRWTLRRDRCECRLCIIIRWRRWRRLLGFSRRFWLREEERLHCCTINE